LGRKVPHDALPFVRVDGALPSLKRYSKAWGDFAAQIEMPDLAFRNLHYTHASQLIDAGVDIVTISKRLGHAKPDITLRIHGHLFQKDDGKAAAAINTALNRQGANRAPISLFVLFGTCAKHLKVLVWKGGRVV
jgi:integrase